jgi:hypothetical protein
VVLSKVSCPLRLLLAALSGLLCGLVPALALPRDLSSLLQGAIFGALVLVPFLGSVRWRTARAVVLVAGGMAIQLMAVRLALHLYIHGPFASPVRLWSAVTPAALAGALLVAALGSAVIPLYADSRFWALATLAGLAGGLLLGLPSGLGAGPAWSFGMVAWQMLVCAALCCGRKPLRSA